MKTKKKAKPMAGLVMMSDHKEGKHSGPDKYEVDNWTRTVVEAMEILHDPKKMKHVKEAIGKKHDAISSFSDLSDKIAKG